MTYAAKIDKAESRIDFAAGTVQVERQIRAFNPAPGAWFEFHGERIKILKATTLPGLEAKPGAPLVPGTVMGPLLIWCGDGALGPLLVQRAGKSAMTMRSCSAASPSPPARSSPDRPNAPFRLHHRI